MGCGGGGEGWGGVRDGGYGCGRRIRRVGKSSMVYIEGRYFLIEE